MIIRIDPKKDPARRSLKMEAWPEADRLAWIAAVRPDSVFEDGGLGAGWAPATRETAIGSYGRWLGWLKRNGLLDPGVGPADRVTPERIREYVADRLQQIAASSMAPCLAHLYCALRAMAPDRDWRWMRGVISLIRGGAVRTRDKQARLVPSGQLFAFGVELMDQADGPAGGTTSHRAQYFRDGLLIALLAARPIRRRNLASIEVGVHLLRQGQGYRLRFAAAETKTDKKIEFMLPGALVPYLERYLSHYRALLNPHTRGSRWATTSPRPPTAALWISMRGTPMDASTIYYRLIALTRAKFGHSISPHLFRDCAATSIATEDPAHVYVAKSVLSHSTFKTTERHYIHAQSLEAAKRYQGEVHDLKRRGRAHRSSAGRGMDIRGPIGTPRKPMLRIVRTSVPNLACGRPPQHRTGPVELQGRPRDEQSFSSATRPLSEEIPPET